MHPALVAAGERHRALVRQIRAANPDMTHREAVQAAKKRSPGGDAALTAVETAEMGAPQYSVSSQFETPGGEEFGGGAAPAAYAPPVLSPAEVVAAAQGTEFGAPASAGRGRGGGGGRGKGKKGGGRGAGGVGAAGPFQPMALFAGDEVYPANYGDVRFNGLVHERGLRTGPQEAAGFWDTLKDIGRDVLHEGSKVVRAAAPVVGGLAMQAGKGLLKKYLHADGCFRSYPAYSGQRAHGQF